MIKGKSGGVFQPQTLDVDESILGRALQIVDSGQTQPAPAQRKTLLSPGDNSLPAVKVAPSPGLCVKSRNVAGDKVFINLCKISQIPPPPHLSEDALKRIIAEEDYGSDFRVPMSLGGPRDETDKSGGACTACDVAVNSVWFEDVMFDSIAFTTFTINVAMEGLCEKYGDRLNLDRQNWTILKNKKYLGTLQKHTIQQRANTPGEHSKITEVTGRKPAVESRDGQPPDYLIVRDPVEGVAKRLVATIQLPGQVSRSGLELDVGEDRLVFGAPKRQPLDIFLPFKIDQSSIDASFDVDRQVLTVEMPLVATAE